MIKGEINIDIAKCKGCQVCIPACPKSIIKVSDSVNTKGYNYVESDNEGCIGCANCAVVCPDGVISVYKVKE
ncbi:ferredoxin [Bacteroidia bacterium]|nr:ferredoxin [Bacteroidia bacterium]